MDSRPKIIECSRCTEELFSGNILRDMTLAPTAHHVIQSDIEIARGLAENIVLAGGSSHIKNFGERLQVEVAKLQPRRVKASVLPV